MAGLDPAIQTLISGAWMPGSRPGMTGLTSGSDKKGSTKGAFMSVDSATVRRIAHLARIKVSEREVPHLQSELNAILAFVEELGTVDVEGVEPMTSVMPMPIKKRTDVVTDGSIPEKIVANAPVSDDHFFVVPKVVE
jgi:aspartyl-tRNA(Asn)/glutamyl-tRNA(Gln) amidotransferase subunit C